MHPPPQHTHKPQTSPWELTLRAPVPATSLPLLPTLCHSFPTAPPTLQPDGTRKRTSCECLRQVKTSSGRPLGARLRPPSQGHPLGYLFQLCTCLGATLIESPSLSASQGPTRTGSPAQPAFRTKTESAGSWRDPGVQQGATTPRATMCGLRARLQQDPPEAQAKWGSLQEAAGRLQGAFCRSAWSQELQMVTWAAHSLPGPACCPHPTPRLLLGDP